MNSYAQGRRGRPAGPAPQTGVYATLSGTVSQLNLNRDAEIDGFLLSNNMVAADENAKCAEEVVKALEDLAQAAVDPTLPTPPSPPKPPASPAVPPPPPL